MSKETTKRPDTENWGDAQWRWLVRRTAEAYLHPDFKPGSRVNARRVAAEHGISAVKSAGLDKAERYALAAAAIHRITSRLIVGEGGKARYRYQYVDQAASRASGIENPLLALPILAGGAFIAAAQEAEADRGTNVRYFLRRYNHRSDEAHHATAGLIRSGGTLPSELESYVTVSARSLQESRATRRYSEKRRVAAAHFMLPLSTGRASQHLGQVVDGQSWSEVERMRPQTTKLNPAELGHTAMVRMLGPDGEDLFPLVGYIAADFEGPRLKCPAHQRIFGTDSALQQQLHAGINMAGDFGIYSPNFELPRLP
jgi:hypothetical protein